MTWTAFNINAPKKQTTTTTNEYVIYVIFILFYINYIYFSLFYIYIFFLFYSLRRHARPVLRVYSTTANEKRSLEKRNNFPRWLVSIYRMIFVFFSSSSSSFYFFFSRPFFTIFRDGH